MYTIVHIRYCWSPLALTRGVSLVEQELLTILKYLSSLPFISGFVVVQSFVLLNVISTTVFVHWSFFIWPLNCLSCPSNYGFRLPFWYLKPFWQIGHSV